jgi:uncharacterized protein YndB with AHSA1/START domain
VSDFTVRLELPHPPSTVFRFLANPHNRPLWQASLRAVAEVDEGEPRVGMSWCDVTRVGIRPSMRITRLTPYRLLEEAGSWRGVDGLLTLRFVRTQGGGTRLTADGRLSGHGAFALAAAFTGRLAPETIRKDLLRASDVLSAHPSR